MIRESLDVGIAAIACDTLQLSRDRQLKLRCVVRRLRQNSEKGKDSKNLKLICVHYSDS